VSVPVRQDIENAVAAGYRGLGVLSVCVELVRERASDPLARGALADALEAAQTYLELSHDMLERLAR